MQLLSSPPHFMHEVSVYIKGTRLVSKTPPDSGLSGFLVSSQTCQSLSASTEAKLFLLCLYFSITLPFCGRPLPRGSRLCSLHCVSC